MATSSTCKLGRVRRQRYLSDPQHESLDEGLIARWKGIGGHTEHGYRSLSEWFNKRVMRTTYEAHGRSVLGNRIGADYDALTGADNSIRHEVRMDIESDGIDVKELESSFISYGTVRTHLLECLGAEKPEPESQSGWEEETIRKARAFAEEKTEEALSSLSTKKAVDGLDSASIEVDITIQCGNCATTVPYEIALRRGYVCETHRTASPPTGGADP